MVSSGCAAGRTASTPACSGRGQAPASACRGRSSCTWAAFRPRRTCPAFLGLELPGSKVVCGGGPLLARYRREFPDVHWLGPLPHERLPWIYAAADVFVHPSRTDTFGLVMLEAMACGTPVAGYPVAGPLDVVGDSAGGALDEDLGRAAARALALPRAGARARALAFDLDRVAAQFVAHLQPLDRAGRQTRLHATVATA